MCLLQTEDLGEIAKKMANLEKANPAKKRIAVITQGDKPTIVSNGKNLIYRYMKYLSAILSMFLLFTPQQEIL